MHVDKSYGSYIHTHGKPPPLSYDHAHTIRDPYYPKQAPIIYKPPPPRKPYPPPRKPYYPPPTELPTVDTTNATSPEPSSSITSFLPTTVEPSTLEPTTNEPTIFATTLFPTSLSTTIIPTSFSSPVFTRDGDDDDVDVDDDSNSESSSSSSSEDEIDIDDDEVIEIEDEDIDDEEEIDVNDDEVIGIDDEINIDDDEVIVIDDEISIEDDEVIGIEDEGIDNEVIEIEDEGIDNEVIEIEDDNINDENALRSSSSSSSEDEIDVDDDEVIEIEGDDIGDEIDVNDNEFIEIEPLSRPTEFPTRSASFLVDNDCQGRIRDITFRYTGGSCSQSDNFQLAEDFSCNDFNGGPLLQGSNAQNFITAVALEGNTNYFSGNVRVGEEYNLNADQTFDRILSNVIITIYESEEGPVLQTTRVHMSCSQPFFVFDRYGANQVIQWVETSGRAVPDSIVVETTGRISDSAIENNNKSFSITSRPSRPSSSSTAKPTHTVSNSNNDGNNSKDDDADDKNNDNRKKRKKRRRNKKKETDNDNDK